MVSDGIQQDPFLRQKFEVDSNDRVLTLFSPFSFAHCSCARITLLLYELSFWNSLLILCPTSSRAFLAKPLPMCFNDVYCSSIKNSAGFFRLLKGGDWSHLRAGFSRRFMAPTRFDPLRFLRFSQLCGLSSSAWSSGLGWWKKRKGWWKAWRLRVNHKSISCNAGIT